MNSIQESNIPIWASWLGIIIIVLGVYLTASNGNQLLKYIVLDGVPSVEKAEYEHKCPEDELEEEGITLAMCMQKTANVDTVLLSIPDWFRGFQIPLMLIGTLVAMASIFAGITLIDYRSYAPTAAAAIIATLLLIDLLGFVAVIITGPLTRQLYLWDILLWCFIHSILLSAIIAGREQSTSDNLNNTGV